MTAPLVPQEVDLRDFQFMPLDVVRLRDSDLAARVTGDEFRAAVLLWCAAWHQQPAASLPDDDVVLSSLAGFGRVVREWLTVKAGALRGWVKCDDGRLYHPVVAQKANEAWLQKLTFSWRRECDRIRKENAVRAKSGSAALAFPPRPNADKTNSEIIPEETVVVADGIPEEIRLNGTDQTGPDRNEDRFSPPLSPDDEKEGEEIKICLERVLKSYPGAAELGPSRIRKVIRAICPDDRVNVAAAAEVYAADFAKKPTTHPLGFVKFVEERRFEGYIAKSTGPPTVFVAIDTPEWSARVAAGHSSSLRSSATVGGRRVEGWRFPAEKTQELTSVEL